MVESNFLCNIIKKLNNLSSKNMLSINEVLINKKTEYEYFENLEPIPMVRSTEVCYF